MTNNNVMAATMSAMSAMQHSGLERKTSHLYRELPARFYELSHQSHSCIPIHIPFYLKHYWWVCPCLNRNWNSITMHIFKLTYWCIHIYIWNILYAKEAHNSLPHSCQVVSDCEGVQCLSMFFPLHLQQLTYLLPPLLVSMSTKSSGGL